MRPLEDVGCCCWEGLELVTLCVSCLQVSGVGCNGETSGKFFDLNSPASSSPRLDGTLCERRGSSSNFKNSVEEVEEGEGLPIEEKEDRSLAEPLVDAKPGLIGDFGVSGGISETGDDGLRLNELEGVTGVIF